MVTTKTFRQRKRKHWVQIIQAIQPATLGAVKVRVLMRGMRILAIRRHCIEAPNPVFSGNLVCQPLIYQPIQHAVERYAV